MFLLALLLAVTPAVELLSTIWPLTPGDLVWRYGALGLAAAYLPNLALGVALVIVMAAWQERPGILRAAGFAGVALALLLLPAMALFAMDLAQVRALSEEQPQTAMVVSGVLQEIKYLASGLALAAMGVGALTSGFRSRPHGGGVLRAGDR